MAIVVVKTKFGEEICSWVFDIEPVSLHESFAGMREAIQDALKKESPPVCSICGGFVPALKIGTIDPCVECMAKIK